MDSEYVYLKIIQEYKKILKRHLNIIEYRSKIVELKLKRKDLSFATHFDLQDKVNRILEDINQLMAMRPNHPSNYCGLSNFASYIRAHINDHILTDAKELVNAQKIASKAVIDAIQLISHNDAHDHMGRIQNHIQTTLRYGTPEQKELLIKALDKHCEKHHSVLYPLKHVVQSSIQSKCQAS